MAALTRLVAIIFAICTPVAHGQDELPEGNGRDVVEYACSQCHDLMRVTQAAKTSSQWRYLVTQMINQGAPIEDYEVETVIAYLSAHFGEK